MDFKLKNMERSMSYKIDPNSLKSGTFVISMSKSLNKVQAPVVDEVPYSPDKSLSIG